MKKPKSPNSVQPKTIRCSDLLSEPTMQIFRKPITTGIHIEQKAYLEIKNPRHPFKDFELRREATIIGRIKDCQIQLNSKGVSRNHARIYYKDEEYYLEDIGSTNGTYVNGIKVLRCVLRSHDLIEIGTSSLIFFEERVRVLNKK